MVCFWLRTFIPGAVVDVVSVVLHLEKGVAVFAAVALPLLKGLDHGAVEASAKLPQILGHRLAHPAI